MSGAVASGAVRLRAGRCGYEWGSAVACGGVKIRAFNAVLAIYVI